MYPRDFFREPVDTIAIDTCLKERLYEGVAKCDEIFLVYSKLTVLFRVGSHRNILKVFWTKIQQHTYGLLKFLMLKCPIRVFEKLPSTRRSVKKQLIKVVVKSRMIYVIIHLDCIIAEVFRKFSLNYSGKRFVHLQHRRPSIFRLAL